MPHAKTFVLAVHAILGSLIDPPPGYDCFVVNIDEEDARSLLRLIRFVRALKRRLGDVYKLELWDSHGGEYQEADWDAETFPAGMIPLETAEHERLIPNGTPSRTECERLMVLDNGVHWAAYPKHADQELETELLPEAVIRGVLDS